MEANLLLQLFPQRPESHGCLRRLNVSGQREWLQRTENVRKSKRGKKKLWLEGKPSVRKNEEGPWSVERGWRQGSVSCAPSSPQQGDAPSRPIAHIYMIAARGQFVDPFCGECAPSLRQIAPCHTILMHTAFHIVFTFFAAPAPMKTVLTLMLQSTRMLPCVPFSGNLAIAPRGTHVWTSTSSRPMDPPTQDYGRRWRVGPVDGQDISTIFLRAMVPREKDQAVYRKRNLLGSVLHPCPSSLVPQRGEPRVLIPGRQLLTT